MSIREYLLILRQLLLMALLCASSRLIFLLVNWSYFHSTQPKDLIYAFVLGFRFDIATVAIFNISYVLSSLIPVRGFLYELWLKLLFIFGNMFWLLINLVDVEYFKFIGKKISADIFHIASDVSGQFLQLVIYYWPLTLLFLFYLSLFIRFSPKYPHYYKAQFSLKNFLIATPVILLIVVTMVRGGLQMRSLSPKQAFVHDQYELGNLTINAAYNFIRSIETPREKPVDYFATNKEALDVIRTARTFSESTLAYKNHNVILIIMESFATEYLINGYMPKLQEMTKKSAYFERNLANGRRSIEALPSILVGLPSLVDEPISQSVYQTNQFISLPSLLKERGYHNAFFHGGKKGTMDFDAYTRSIGIKDYYSLEDNKNPAYFDGHWGVYDHHFFDFMIEKLDTFQTPFMASFFSLSSHQPYSIPAEMKNKFPKGRLEIHESIGYADWALDRFFESIKNKPWYKNTLFIITADHTQKLEDVGISELTRYRTPLVFFHPSVDLSIYSSKRVTSHADIFPSVVDFLDIPQSAKLFFGSSVFNQDSGRAINYNNGRYMLATDNYFLSSDGNKHKLYEFDELMNVRGPIEDPEALGFILKEWRAFVQYTKNGLIKNQIYQAF